MEQIRFRFQCQRTRVVKTYMLMTPRKAESLSSQLARERSYCNWVPTTNGAIVIGSLAGAVRLIS